MDAKEEIKQKLGIEEVVGEYLELKRAGRNFKALSPFKAEKTASFMVSPEKGIWHDFSSNQGGDIFSFVMLMEGIDFVEAMRLLAPKAGVDLSQHQGDGRTAQRKKRLQEALHLATRYYQQSLLSNRAALEYIVNKRGYGKAVIGDFQLGYSPATGTALLHALKKKKFTEQELKDAGLITHTRGAWRDMFRGRVMVPLHDGQGNVIGFTARVLDNSLPKYINTPQTLLYDKSRHVFGLHVAKEAIRRAGFVVLVEGNMDVVASHKVDVKNVVATAGTAMTAQHLKQLNRLSEDVRLAFDQDSAGIQATERAIPIAQEVGVRLSIIDIEGGKDPDDLIKENPAQWQQTIEQSKYVMDWLIDKYSATLDLTTAEGKRNFTDRTLATLASVKDAVERSHYVDHIAALIKVDKVSVQTKLDALEKKGKRLPKKRIKADLAQLKNQDQIKSAYQDLLLGLNLLFPAVKDSLKGVEPHWFSGESRRSVAEYVLAGVGDPVTKTPPQLHRLDDYVKIVLFKTEELYDAWSESDRIIEAVGLAHRLARDYKTHTKTQLGQQLRQAEADGDDTKREALLREFNELIKDKDS